jgi:PAS domain S-box-containing protein
LHGGSGLIDEGDRIKGKILQELRSNPKGLTVSEVSRKIGLNRNSTAKYLDILRINGRIDMRALGRAKMFYISQRVPISALLNFSTDYILVLDASMRIVETNENFLKFFKVKKEMLLDVPLLSANLPILTTKESLKKIKKAIEGKGSTFEMEILMEEGFRYFKGKLIPSTLGDGGNGVTIIMENITEQKRAQIRLKESEERYRDLIQNQGEGVGLTDPMDVFTFANPAAERLMGVAPGMLVGRTVMDFLPKDQIGKVLLHHERRKKGRRDTYQLEIIADDGKRKTILLTATPRYDDEGNFLGSFGVFRDITRMKESERKMAESEQRYRLLFEFTSDTLLILEDRKIIDCNNSTLSMFGYSSKEDIIGLDPKDLSPPEQEGGISSDLEVRRKINEAREKGLITFNWIHRKKDGTDFITDIQLQSIRIGGESLFQARMRDITEIVQAKKELQEKEARLNNILSSLHGSFIGLLNRDLIFEDFWGTEELDEIYGIRGKSLEGMSILDFVQEDLKSDIENNLKEVFETGIPYRTEHRAVLPSGRFWQDW